MKFGNLKDVLAFAIRREEEAARTYRKLTTMAKEESAKKLLSDLEADEKNHKKILQGLTKARIEAAAFKTVKDLMISDYLVEEPLAPDMNFQDLLIFAAKKEKKAVDLYLDLAKKSTIKEHRTLFEFLAKQEKVHKLRLELEYEKHVLWED
ncbi:MAG: ferritin family protein [Candidatus Aminicenantes bacterium]|nr:ferritin family protein [Candidatus Aminicenantes bacterium]